MNRSIALRTAVVALVLLSAPISNGQSIERQGDATYWFGSQSDGSVFVLELRDSGELRFSPETGVISKGTWKREADKLEMELNKGFVRLSGIIEDNHVEGVATTRKAAHWTWSATRQPEVIETPGVSYPPLAAAARVAGTVMVEVEIDSVGAVTSMRSIKGHPLLRDAASAAAKKYRFKPDERAGIRTARLAFIFRDESVENPIHVILSPYQIAVNHRSLIIEKSYSHLRGNHD
jgi:TonB family protein